MEEYLKTLHAPGLTKEQAILAWVNSIAPGNTDFLRRVEGALADHDTNGVMVEWARNVHPDGGDTCQQQHLGQCGVCVGSNWYPCG